MDNLTAIQLAELAALCERGNQLRSDLDDVERAIEVLVGVDLDCLDELLGNGGGVDDVMEAAKETEEESGYNA